MIAIYFLGVCFAGLLIWSFITRPKTERRTVKSSLDKALVDGAAVGLVASRELYKGVSIGGKRLADRVKERADEIAVARASKAIESPNAEQDAAHLTPQQKRAKQRRSQRELGE